ncbi:MAG: hypothetical protein JSU86_11655, partial [Phycisphaerales bacterium]
KQTTATRSLYGVALCRQQKTAEASRIAATLQVPQAAGPGTVYCTARLQAAVGNNGEALGLLTRCFQSVAPSRLAGLKNHAQQSPDFAGLVSTPEFAQVLATKSKVPESKCSGGSRCAGCPMRGQCPGSRGQ